MVKLQCLAMTYLPEEEDGDILFRFEDDTEGDTYDVPESRVEEFLATGNFQRTSGSEPGFQGGDIELSPAERTCLQALLPETADAGSLGIILELQTQLKTTGAARNQPKIINIGAEGLEIITSEFRELNNQGELPLEWLQTYQRFN